MNKMKKEAVLAVRFHQQHLTELTKKAEDNFMSVSDYVRLLVQRDLEKAADGQVA